MKKILVVASGIPEGGGTGCAHIIRCALAGLIDAEVVGVLSDHANGGVREKAESLGVPFFLFTPQTSYADVVKKSGADIVVFCGWRRDVYGLDPKKTVAIVRGSNGDEAYFSAHKFAADNLYSLGRAGGKQPEVIIRFVTGPTVHNGPVIIRIPVGVRVGPDFQLPCPAGRKREELGLPLFSGTPEQRLARIVKFWLRETQRHYVPQLLNHVITGRVRLVGKKRPRVISPKAFKVTRRWIENSSA